MSNGAHPVTYRISIKQRLHMFKVFFQSIVLLLILSGCSSEPERIIVAKNSKILAFGDSLTQGVGANKAQSYPSQLSNILGIDVVNEGVSGEVSEKGLQRLERYLATNTVDLVILCHGGNDLLRKLPKAKLKANLANMINLIQSSGAQVLLVGVPKPAILLSTFPVYEELAEEYNLVSDLESLTDLLGSPAMKSDGVHLNAQGYRAFAESLAKRINVI